MVYMHASTLQLLYGEDSYMTFILVLNHTLAFLAHLASHSMLIILLIVSDR